MNDHEISSTCPPFMSSRYHRSGDSKTRSFKLEDYSRLPMPLGAEPARPQGLSPHNYACFVRDLMLFNLDDSSPFDKL